MPQVLVKLVAAGAFDSYMTGSLGSESVISGVRCMHGSHASRGIHKGFG